ncbi:MAG: efflux RND transporter periplasmic adaptor subunit [Burkholderiales bacterium]
MALTGRLKPTYIVWALLILLLGGGYYFWTKRNPVAAQDKYQTQTVDRGKVVQVLTANGTLNPVVLVNVGTQVSGTVLKIHADFNSPVTAGQVLAELDPSLFNAQVKQSEANLNSAMASLTLAQTKEARSRDLVAKGFIAPQELDQAVQTLDAARAQVNVARAQLDKDKTNLRYTVIRSPISGVVIARNVDVGTTVAASFQTPTIFQIAQDLKDMQIDTSLAEADIGAVKVGLPVRFSVDAFADRMFKGAVKQIRLNPSIQQNVVSYNVVVAADNSEGTLMPGMTARVSVTANQRDNVLRVPNAALRFKPKDIAADAKSPARREPGAKVYKLVNGQLQAVTIKTGINDNTFTEIVEGDIKEGDKLVTRETTTTDDKTNGFRLRAM